MSDLIKRSDAIKALRLEYPMMPMFKSLREEWAIKTEGFRKAEEVIMSVPSADRPSAVDLSSVYSTAYKSGYEKGKADGAMIYGNEHNCIMTIFGECSYAETGCGDCAVVEKVRKALSADRPQEWIPCSERLPDEDGQYLVWSVIGIVPDHVDGPSTYQGITIAGYYGNARPIKWLGSVEKVLAWMPLPEPWKGADDE